MIKIELDKNGTPVFGSLDDLIPEEEKFFKDEELEELDKKQSKRNAGVDKKDRLEYYKKRIKEMDEEEHKSPLGLFYNSYFKDTTDCKYLDEQYTKSLFKFPIIFASDEISVYKICHHFYTKFNINKLNIKTVAGLAIESYLDPYANHKYNMIQMEKMVEDGVLRDVVSRWVVIPDMSTVWTPKLAYLLYNTLKDAGAIGLIFHSEGTDNLGKIMIEQTPLDVLQFPFKVYDNRKQLEDNEY